MSAVAKKKEGAHTEGRSLVGRGLGVSADKVKNTQGKALRGNTEFFRI